MSVTAVEQGLLDQYVRRRLSSVRLSRVSMEPRALRELINTPVNAGQVNYVFIYFLNINIIYICYSIFFDSHFIYIRQ